MLPSPKKSENGSPANIPNHFVSEFTALSERFVRLNLISDNNPLFFRRSRERPQPLSVLLQIPRDIFYLICRYLRSVEVGFSCITILI